MKTISVIGSSIVPITRQFTFWLPVACILSIGMAGSILSASLMDILFHHPIAGADASKTVLISGAVQPPGLDRIRYWSQTPSLEEIATYSSGRAVLTFGRKSRLSPTVTIVSPGFFNVLGVETNPPGKIQTHSGEYQAFLSKAFSQRYFEDVPPALGTLLDIDGKAVSFLGLVPTQFNFPGHTDIWIIDPDRSFQLNEDAKSQSDLGLKLNDALLGRLRGNASIDTAQAEIRTLQDRLAIIYGQNGHQLTGLPIVIRPLQQVVAASVSLEYRSAVVSGAALFLLSLFNIIGLTSSRWRRRRHEIAIRLMCGASTADIVSLCALEALVISVVGSLLGLVGASFAFNVVRRTMMHQIPSIIGIGLDKYSLLIAVLAFFSVAFGIMFMSLASINISDPTPYSRAKMARTGDDRHRFLLTVLQIALASVLVSTAIASINRMRDLKRIDPGFQPQGLTLLSISSEDAHPVEPSELKALLDKFSGIAGVQHLSIVDRAPLSHLSQRYIVIPPRLAGDSNISANITHYLGDPIETFQLSPIGRRIQSCSQNCIIVNEFLARHAGEHPLIAGDPILLPRDKFPRLIEAVVADVKSAGIEDQKEAQIYVPITSPYFPLQLKAFTVAARSPDSSISISPSEAINAIQQIDSKLDLTVTQTGDAITDAALQGDISRLRISEWTAAIATCVAIIGIYLFLSNMVFLKRYEIALWQVFGANRASIVRWVISRAISSVSLGTAAGILVLVVFRALISNTVGIVLRFTALSGLGAFLLLVLLALLATVMPLWSALKVEPVEILKAE
jgi:putative ABC transport system permease protein